MHATGVMDENSLYVHIKERFINDVDVVESWHIQRLKSKIARNIIIELCL